jgi:predicted esterase
VESEAEKLNINNLMSLLQGTSADAIKLSGHVLFLGWMRSQSESKPPDYIRALTVPVLVVQGAGDELVPVEQARQLMQTLEARGGGTQELALFKGLGHDFGPFISEGDSVPYRAHPKIDRSVLEKVSGWLKGR